MMIQCSKIEASTQTVSNNDTITIIMATFNGGKYLKEQLDSIINQSYKNWRLVVRDDGSSDNTLTILNDYNTRYNCIEVITDSKNNLGISLNFAELMEHSKDSKYIMFSDQDDVWLSNKVEDIYKLMKATEQEYGQNMPSLVYSDLQLVDESLNYIVVPVNMNRCFNATKSKINLNYLLAENFIYGCTMMLNNSLLKVCLPVPVEAENHDYWVSLVAVSIGRIVKLTKPCILFRQHSLNNSGGISRGSFANRFKRVLFGWKEIDYIVNMRIKQALVLKERVLHRLDDKNKKMLTDYLSKAATGGISAVYSAIRNNIYKHSIASTFMFYIALFRVRKDN